MTSEEQLVGYLKRIAADLHDTRARLREVEDGQREPVAIVAMACRYPGGVTSPEELWDLVRRGGHAMTAFPDDRGWDLERLFHPDPDHPGTSYAREGGFLHDAAMFDPEFFGISPREAAAIDPQQRLLLETAWEVLERAGIDPASLKGAPVGVYAGTALPGFGTPHIDAAAEGHLVTGNAPSVLSGRVAYTLGLEGPAVTVDTACSSSLVAAHLAVQALRQGECSLALAGGVTVMTTPHVFTEFARQRGLAADSRCKAFSAAADGTAFSEGVGLLLLERLSEARRNGHQVLAVIRGSAVNQDGASNGLTAPNGLAQQRVIRQALESARLSPADVDAVEAHGTGTRLGDPIEAEALLAVYGQDRPAGRPLWLGAVKANLGHTQGAAGVAGVIKMVMAMRHGMLPANPHADRPTPAVDWDSGAVRLLAEPVAWPDERTRRAGVSSFGISGTNAHLILESAERTATEPVAAPPSLPLPPPMPEGTTVPWVLSGRSASALRAQAEALGEHVAAHPAVSVRDIGWSLAATRSAFEHRAVVLAADRAQLCTRLAALAEGRAHADVVSGAIAADLGGTAFLFTGQGAQRPGMGARLYRTYPMFARAFDDACAALDPLLGRSLKDLVFDSGSDSPRALDRTGATQAALFAVEVALYRLVESFGLEPGYLAGHSVGELTAAHVAGVLSLADAARLVSARGRLMEALPEGGAMVAVEAAEDEVAPLLAEHGGRVALAAVNAPTAVVISGDEDAVEEVAAALRGRGRQIKRLRVSHAFHSPRIDPMLDEFRRIAGSLTFEPPRIAVVSNVTGALADAAQLCDPDYWVRHARQPVRFRDGIAALRAEGVTRFLELGPDAVLTTMSRDCLTAEESQQPQSPVFAAVLRDGRDEVRTLLGALASVHVDGERVDFAAAFPAGAARTELPTYRFERRRYWRTAPSAEADVRAAGLERSEHPLLPAIVEPADGGLLLTGRLSLRDQPWLGDHAIVDGVPLPGTVFLELALLAAERAGCDVVDDITVEAPLLLPPAGAVRIQVAIGAADPAGRRPLTIHSRPAANGAADPAGTGANDDEAGDAAEADAWRRHATGVLCEAPEAEADAAAPLTQWPPADGVPIDVAALYERLEDEGYRYGPAFRSVHAAWRVGDEMYAEIRAGAEQQADCGRFTLHPALLDGALHPIDEMFTGEDQAGGAAGTVRLPFSFGGVRVSARGASRLRVRIVPTGPDSVSMALADGTTGEPIGTISSLTLRTVSADRWRSARGPAGPVPYRMDWQALTLPDEAAAAGRWAVVCCDLPDLAAEAAARYPDFAALTASIAAGATAPDLIVLAVSTGQGPNDGEPPSRVRAATRQILADVQAWLADDRLAASRLVVTTNRAVAVHDDAVDTNDVPADLAGAAVLGLLRAVQIEHPGRVLLVDLDDDAASRRALVRAISAADDSGETQLAVRAGLARVPRLVRAVPDQDPAPPALDPDGTVLMTGGTGALGRLLARHLVEAHGARHLVLAGRRGLATEGIAQFADELPADVRVEACDTTDPHALAALLATIPAAHPLTAVVHAAGVLDDSVVSQLTTEQLDAVLAPKVDAAWHLYRLTRDADLASFLMFSSGASVLGSGGQSNYGAANAFLNALAERIRAEGGRATALAWGLWAAGEGMTEHLTAADLARMTRSGTAAMSEEYGLALFDSALACALPVLVPARFDLGVLRDQAAAGTLPPLLRRMVRSTRRTGTAPKGPEWGERLAGLSEAEQERVIGELIRDQVAHVLAHPDGRSVETGRTFLQLGLDSLTALELRNNLGAATGIRLPATAVFDYPTPVALARHMRTELLGAGAVSAAPVQARPTAHVQAGNATDPIVIVGMACRYPGGVTSADALWDLVVSGTDAIGPFPTDRGWDVDALYDADPDHVGTSYVREGGFLYDAGAFDAAFFNISPREALATDPQQRLLLETAWQAFEHARIDPSTLRGSRTAVITGVMYDDYGARFLGRIPDGYEGQIMTGSTPSVASGRVAYTFGLEGPAVTLDTACSSSLVAIHLAAQALRQGECDLALAGGVTVMATPNTFVEFSRQRGLAADGRCKPFAAAADGTGWGEGVGLLVLERLSDARRNGHRVLAIVRGSAVNQDGASNGLTAPNGPSQQRVIHQALASADLTAADIDAVEAHGTGTTLGDPIEAHALLATYGQSRPQDQPLWLGSVKSNIGHTQAAAGAAGVIKMVMAMRNGTLPKTLHVDEPSSHVEWNTGAVSLLTETRPWVTPDDRPRRAAVSSFGISGTNAHVILEQAPDIADAADAASQPTTSATGDVVSWLLSARDDQALRDQAAALAEHLRANQSTPAVDVAWSLATTRATFQQRAVIIGHERDEMGAALAALASGGEHPALVRGAARDAGAGVAFVFPGQGSQWPGMALGLLDTCPVFADAIAACERALAPYVDWSLTEVLRGTDPETDPNRVDVLQPTLFATMVALARTWQHHGVTPTAVIGHSQGEIAAAHIAGALSLPDAAKTVALRSKALRTIADQGTMASLTLSADDTAALISELTLGDQVTIAAHNSPTTTVIAGTPDAVATVLDAAQQRHGARTRNIDVDYASHSPHIEPLRDELLSALADLAPGRPTVAFYSTVTTQRVTTEPLDADYWYTNLRQPVRFHDTLSHLLAEGHQHLVEISPHPVLTPAIHDTLHHTDTHAATIPTLHRHQGTRTDLTHALAHAHTTGIPVTFTHPDPASPPATTDLPTYPFQRHHYWLPAAHAGTSAEHTPVRHPHLSTAIEHPDGSVTLTGRLPSARAAGWLAEHRIADTPLVPGAALIEWALLAADHARCARVEELILHAPLALPLDDALHLHVVLDPPDHNRDRDLHIWSRPARHAADTHPWTRHATGRVAAASGTGADAEAGTATDTAALSASWPPPGAQPLETADFYERTAALGYHYGPAFQGMTAAWRHGTDLLAEITLPEAAGDAGDFGIHPALLDAALHPSALNNTADDADDSQLRLPHTWHGITLHATQARTARVRISALEDGFRLLVADTAGSPVLSAESVTVRVTTARQVREAGARRVDGLFTVAWTPLPETQPGSAAQAATLAAEQRALLGDGLLPLDGAQTRLPHYADVDALLAAQDEGAAIPATVLVGVPQDSAHDDTSASALAATTSTLTLVQRWVTEPRLADARLVLVTRRAVTTDDENRSGENGAYENGADLDLAGASIWGLIRSAQTEYPDRFLLCDIDDATGLDDVLDAVTRAAVLDEPQVAVRDGRLLAPRLERATTPELALPLGERAWRLAADGSGTVESVSVVPCPEALEPLAPGQVRVAVRAAGVNFRDVLIVLGMYPGNGVFRGSEGAGVVLEVAPDVTSVAVGDRVMGLLEGAFGPIVVTDARTLIPIPEGWTDEQAASIPVNFLTAWYGLVDLGGLAAGDRVLIHSATGGVGHAAVQIARHLGAEIYATASPAKHPVLRAMGIDPARAASSRDLDFEAAFRIATGGRGFDVVLNSLAGDYTDASLRLLAEGGRFIEMGKTDLRDPQQLAQHYPTIEYRPYDLVPHAGLDHIAHMLHTLAPLFADGTLTPAPVQTWPLAKARHALRYMSQAKHTGKLVLTVPRTLDPDGTILITGGTGTLAAHTAEHLVTTWNVKHLHLLSRRGADAPGATELRRRLTELGATVTFSATDATDISALRRALDGIDPDHPLTGVIHTAATLDDAVLTSQTPERLAAVWHNKAATAANLHRATKDLPLALFALYSSATGTLGNPGQANYGAANAYCDALATRRHRDGLPAVSIAWGLWASTSSITQQLTQTDHARLSRAGTTPLTTAHALSLFDSAYQHGDACLTALDLDPRALAAGPADAVPVMLRAIAAAGAPLRRAAAADRPADWADRLSLLPDTDRHRELVSLIRTHAATVLGHSDPAAVRSDSSFKELGFDSLTAVELRNRLAAATGLRLSAALVFDYPDAEVMARHLAAKIVPAKQEAATADPLAPVLSDLARLEATLSGYEADGKSRETIAGRLRGLLSRLETRPADATDIDDAALGVASDEEMFALIDQHLGSS